MKRKLSLILITSCLLISCGTKNVDNTSTMSKEEPTTTETPKNSIDVFLIAGQSNANGNGYIEDIKNQDLKEYTNTYFYGGGHCTSKDKLEHVSSIMGQGKGSENFMFGMEVGMSEIFEQKYKNDKTAIIKCAFNGSSIKNPSSNGDRNVFDDVGKGDNYLALKETTTKGLSELEKLGYTPRIKALAWHQGEADYNSCPDYKKRILALKNKIVEDFNAPNLILAMGELAMQNFPNQSSDVALGLYNAQGYDREHNVLVEIKELKTRCTQAESNSGAFGAWDFLHWSGDEMIEIGKRYANSILKLM